MLIAVGAPRRLLDLIVTLMMTFIAQLGDQEGIIAGLSLVVLREPLAEKKEPNERRQNEDHKKRDGQRKVTVKSELLDDVRF